jgi:glyoxylate/hydroxypyruvate reductase
MSLLLAIMGAGGNWSGATWADRFTKRLPGRPVWLWPNETIDLAAVKYAAVWKPPPGLLARCPNLEVIFNLGAGVDALLGDPTLPPNVPLIRIANTDLTKRMTEYVALHVLLHHRRQRELDAAQRAGRWAAPDQWAASAVRVGIMGLGELGRDSAEVLARLGFKVRGWSRSRRDLPGVHCFAGARELDAFLAETDILVALMPLTSETSGILDRDLFRKLARNGVLGGPVLINAGRGGLQIETDILACLDDGTLVGATLDVFETEPLPPSSRLWTHPRVTLTPHNAADSDPDTISDDVAAQILAFERGQPLKNVVDRAREY